MPVGDRRNPLAERRGRVRPRPVDGERVRRSDEVGRHCRGMRRQRVVPGDGAPGLEASPRRGVSPTGTGRARCRHRPLDPSSNLRRQVWKHRRGTRQNDRNNVRAVYELAFHHGQDCIGHLRHGSRTGNTLTRCFVRDGAGRKILVGHRTQTVGDYRRRLISA